MATILVTGAAGYIGSVIIERLAARGDTPLALDDFSQGHRDALPPGVPVVQADLCDAHAVEQVFARHAIESVVHMAAVSLVSDSVRQPVRYYQQNVANLLPLLDVMLRHDCRRLVLSSTAAVYGEPAQSPIFEDCVAAPINPYGWTKLMCEQILGDVRRASTDGAAFEYVSLRYFNVAGATDRCAEMHRPESHLIPRVLEVALGLRPHLELYGTDYPTPDGTCIRDYIHVTDLAEAHVLALDHTRHASGVFNLGNNRGYSVREVVQCAERVTGRKIPLVEHPRRPGDPPQLVASHRKAKEVLGWNPRLGLDDMISSAWHWRRQHPQGYAR